MARRARPADPPMCAPQFERVSGRLPGYGAFDENVVKPRSALYQNGRQGRLTLLSDADIIRAITHVRLEVSAALRTELRDRLNEVVVLTVLYRERRNQRLPHYVLKQARLLQAEALQALTTAIRIFDYLPASREEDDFGEAVNDLEGFIRIRLSAKRIEQAIVAKPHQAKQPDYWRYRMIRAFAEIYEEFIGRPPSTTRGGPWSGFLEEILGGCERRKPEDAHNLWIKVKKWDRKCDSGIQRISWDAIPPDASGLYIVDGAPEGRVSHRK